MTDSTEDFAAMFEASMPAKRFERGQTLEGTLADLVGGLDVQGDAGDRAERLTHCRTASGAFACPCSNTFSNSSSAWR